MWPAVSLERLIVRSEGCRPVAKGVGYLRTSIRRSTVVFPVLSIPSATRLHFSPDKTVVVYCFVAFKLETCWLSASLTVHHAPANVLIHALA